MNFKELMQTIATRRANGTVTSLTTEQYDRLREKSINELPGELKYLDCPICLNKGYVAKIVNGVVSTPPCSCMAKRKSLERITNSGLSGLMQDCTFATYQTPEQWQKDAKQKAMDYSRNHDGKWFLASGAVGSGKTHLCTAIAAALLNQGEEVRYMLWRDESVRLKAAVNDDAEYDRLISTLKKCKALYIDDLFKGGVTGPDIKLAFEILNSRYSNKNMITIISTEKTPEELLAIDEAIGSRIWERSKGFSVVVSGHHNWRLK